MKKLLPLCIVCLAFLVGCTLPRREAPVGLFATATPVGFPSAVRYYSADWRNLGQPFAEKLDRVRNASPDGTVNVLALSGGGAAGAFGAGALVGLSHRGERPEFQVVTGVSTGALIAPFAFLGPEWDPQLTAAFSGERTEHLLSAHWLESLFRPGLYDNRPLAALVDDYITLDLLHAVAREAARGRLLEVATTDLDREETVMWDMGAIAARGDESARQLFRDVLLASASVPGAFRPILLHVEDASGVHDEMHVDGATTVPFVGAPEIAFFSSLEWAGLRGGKIYVLINGQFASTPSTTRFSTVPVLARSVSAATRHMTRMQLATTAQFAAAHGMDLRLTAVPADYSEVSMLDFRPTTMRALFNYGVSCSERGRLWTTLDQAIARAEKATAGWQRTGVGSQPQRMLECPLDESAVAPGVALQQVTRSVRDERTVE